MQVYLAQELILDDICTAGTGSRHLSLVQPSLVPACITLPGPALQLFSQQSYAAAQSATAQSATPAEVVAFAHAMLVSPALSTIHEKLDRGFLPSFMGLSVKTPRKYPPQSIAMIKGHLDQDRKNQRSTRSTPTSTRAPSDPTSSLEVAYPCSDPDNMRTHQCFAVVIKPAASQIHSDQTGKFIVASSAGNNYVVFVYDHDCCSILVKPMRCRTGPCIVTAFPTLHARVVAARLKPQLHRLDNESFVALKAFLRDSDIDFQLFPPQLHRRNAAERAIRTFMNHFIAGLSGVDKNVPLHLWDKLLPQAELTLNMLQGSRTNP